MRNKTVLLTGAAGCIGAAVAGRLAREGAAVVLTDIDEDRGMAVAREVVSAGGRAEFLPLDVTREQDWSRVVGQVLAGYGRIDVLVNNAGLYVVAPLARTTVEEWDRVMAVNVTGVFLGMKHVAPRMAEAGGGAIVNMSSAAGVVGVAGHTLYGASKGAVRTMSKDVAAEYGSAGVRVNSLHPAYVRTPMAEYGARAAGLDVDELAAVSPLGRLAETSDVADFVLFLASDEAGYLTGGEYAVDGGGTSLVSLR